MNAVTTNRHPIRSDPSHRVMFTPDRMNACWRGGIRADPCLPGGLFALHSRTRQPFCKGPNMIGQSGCQGRASRLPRAVLVFDPQSPYGPAKVVTVPREVGHRLLDLPVLRETVG